jgi:hypothetical protein
LEVTRTAPVIQLAVTHGEGAPEILKAHPATTKGAGCVTIGCPLTVTLGIGVVACACPPCAQSTVAPTCSKNPGMVVF